MTYLQRVVLNALQNSENVAHEAEAYAERMQDFSDLLSLDGKNLRLVADELGATPEQMCGFLEVVKALWNGGKVGNEIYIQGYVPGRVLEQAEQIGGYSAKRILEYVE